LFVCIIIICIFWYFYSQWDFEKGGFKNAGCTRHQDTKMLVYDSQVNIYNMYCEEFPDPENRLSLSMFKGVMHDNNYTRAKGCIDACNICNSLIPVNDPLEKLAIESHKSLVKLIGSSLQGIEANLFRGYFLFI
jgi:hypothetical protein